MVVVGPEAAPNMIREGRRVVGGRRYRLIFDLDETWHPRGGEEPFQSC